MLLSSLLLTPIPFLVFFFIVYLLICRGIYYVVCVVPSPHIFTSLLLQSSFNPNSQHTSCFDSNQEHNDSDSDTNYDGDCDPGSDGDCGNDLDERIVRKNIRDSEKYNELDDELCKIDKLHDTAAKLEMGEYITEDRLQEYQSAGCPSLETLSEKIGETSQKMDYLEDKIEDRKQVGYEPSPSPDPSPSPKPSSSPESSADISGFSPAESMDLDSNEQLIFPLFLCTGFPVVSVLCIFYRLYTTRYFKMLIFYFSLSNKI